LVWFRFYKPKTEPNRTELKPKKTEPNRKNQAKSKKPSQIGKTEPNWFEPVFVLKNRIETGRFEPVSVQFEFF
jgi:hypothetical protein